VGVILLKTSIFLLCDHMAFPVCAGEQGGSLWCLL
jgi:hypothetical protein